MSEEFRAFWSVIPATVLDDMSIPANAKILYGVLSSLMRSEGYCWPSNAQLAEAMHCSEDTASRLVAALDKAGHIRVFVLPNRKTGGSIRRIYPSLPEPVFDAQDGYSAKMPSTYSAKKPRVLGKNAEPYIMMDNKKIEKKKKEKENTAAMAAASSILDRCAAFGFDVESAMQRFLQMRMEIKKPVKSKQSATMLWNKMLDLSNGDASQMVKLLDKATEHQWLSLYPLKDDELPIQSASVDTGGMRVL